MNNKYDFGRAFSDFDEDFDPFAIPERAVNCFDDDDEFLDMNTFVLAAVACICLENSDEAGNDYCIFSQLSLLLHPDRSAANYALHYARMLVNRLPVMSGFESGTCITVYQELEAALRRILAKVCGSEKKLEKLFDRHDYDDILYYTDEFLGEECEAAYPNDPFFAFSVALYTSLSLNAKRDDAVSFMYEHLPYLDTAPQNCFDVICDAIRLGDKIDVRAFQSKHSFTALIWFIFKALTEYYEKMFENEWEFEKYSADWSALDDIPGSGDDEAADEEDDLDEAFDFSDDDDDEEDDFDEAFDFSDDDDDEEDDLDEVFDFSDEDDEETDEDDAGFDEVFDFSGDDEEEEDALAFEDVFELRDEEETA
jgi:hypothetical protein